MNKLLKSTLIAGGVMGAFFASNANAQSLNVLIDEIELVSDADNYISTAATVYKPSVGVGAATTTTVDFFADSSERFSLEKPSTGVYESMIIHFDTVEAVSAGSTDLDLTTAFDTAFFHDYGGRDIAVFGALGAGAQSIATITGASTAVGMQPVVVTAGNFSIPEINLNLPSSSIVIDGTDVALDGVFEPFTLAANVDSADVPDMMIDVDPSVFDGVTGFTSGTSRITVGLFTDGDLGPRPMFSQRFRPSKNTGAGDLEVITFYDVPEGDVVPIAWFDADNDTMLDQGEWLTMHDNNVATSVNTVAAVDVSYTAGNGILDAAAVAFGYRDIDLTIPVSDTSVLTSLDIGDTAEFEEGGITVDPDAGINGVLASATSTTNSALEISYAVFDDGTTQVSRSFEIAIALGESENTGGTAGTLETADTDATVVIGNTDSTDAITGATFTSASNTLVIADIPFTLINDVDANNVGEYTIQMTVFDDDDSHDTGLFLISEDTSGADEEEDPVAGALTVNPTAGDGANTDGVIGTIALGTL